MNKVVFFLRSEDSMQDFNNINNKDERFIKESFTLLSSIGENIKKIKSQLIIDHNSLDVLVFTRMILTDLGYFFDSIASFSHKKESNIVSFKKFSTYKFKTCQFLYELMEDYHLVWRGYVAERPDGFKDMYDTKNAGLVFDIFIPIYKFSQHLHKRSDVQLPSSLNTNSCLSFG